MPTFPALVERRRLNRFAKKIMNRSPPEGHRLLISAHNTNLPFPGKFSPNVVRRLRPEPGPTKTTNDEELRHIPDVCVARNFGAPTHEDKAGEVAVGLD